MQNSSILFLTNSYPDFDTSYRGIFIKKMATLIQGEGCEVTVVTPKIYKGSRYFENQDGIGVYRFPFFSGNKLLIEYAKVPYLRMILYYLSGFIMTICILMKTRNRVIHVHWAIPIGVIGAMVNLLFRKFLILTIHGSDLRLAMEKQGLLRRLFVFVCKRADHVNCVSEIQKKEMEEIGVNGKNITVIPMGVDHAFIEARGRRKMKSENRSFTILSNRNLLPIYNLSLLIRSIPFVLKEEPETTFLIAGEGPEKQKLEQEAKSLHIHSNVKFLGRVSHEKMPELLSGSDIYVSTSLFDGTSVSLLEAMASGAFPIVTDIPPNREWIVNGENGLLTPIGEETVLAKKIIEAIRNQSLVKEASEKNLRIIQERASWENDIKRFIGLYQPVS